MPELTVHSTPALHPLPPSLYAVPPDDPGEPSVPPAKTLPTEPATEKGIQVAPPDYAAALRKVGEMLFTMILESYDPWPGWPESSTRTELRAALADLRHLEGFLGAVGREHVVSSLGREDDRLSRFAARQAAEVARIAHRIDAELAKSMHPQAEEA